MVGRWRTQLSPPSTGRSSRNYPACWRTVPVFEVDGTRGTQGQSPFGDSASGVGATSAPDSLPACGEGVSGGEGLVDDAVALRQVQERVA